MTSILPILLLAGSLMAAPTVTNNVPPSLPAITNIQYGPYLPAPIKTNVLNIAWDFPSNFDKTSEWFTVGLTTNFKQWINIDEVVTNIYQYISTNGIAILRVGISRD